MSSRALHRRVMWPVIGVLLIIGLAVYAILGRSPSPPGSADALRAWPEAALIYPGSDVIDSGGRNASVEVTGRLSAAAWQVLGVDADGEAIEEFYATELAARGWIVDTRTSSGISTVREASTQAWSKDGVIFRLAIHDPEYWRADPDLFSRYRSVYDARLIGDRRLDD